MGEETVNSIEQGRYLRQMKLLGADGQEKLRKATVFIAGVGGLGGTTALYLAAAGVGKLILAHEGVIALPDLNRQILMTDERLGMERVSTAADSIHRLNPEVEVEIHAERIQYDRGRAWVEDADIAVDARYDFPERYELNRLCRDYGKPMVEAAMYGFEISLTTFVPEQTPCLECLYPSPGAWEPLGFPVLGAVSGMAGCMAAMEAVKWITGVGRVSAGALFRYDTLSNSAYQVDLTGVPMCPACRARAEARRAKAIG
ncbi:HesA/MoeB/ThiF family protein [Gorillibacterium massiliense]|uniref:HesA/MoeB/ThiF family protein n=1 Tax=Gorillibacterium massiliense TaxID=1280390 RepID=UPI0004BCA033|nr:HesA/MoeB/ThiF family protein [Gorillibacterium massiliense]